MFLLPSGHFAISTTSTTWFSGEAGLSLHTTRCPCTGWASHGVEEVSVTSRAGVEMLRLAVEAVMQPPWALVTY